MELKIKKLDYKYKQNKLPSLSNINANLDLTKPLAIIGETGSGKSTFLNVISTLELPTEGSIEILGHTISSTTKYKELVEVRRQISVLFQDSEQQLFKENILEDVLFGAKNFGICSDKLIEEAKQMLLEFGITEEMLTKDFFSLSGGQNRVVAICAALIIKPRILFLDEPTIGLDPQKREKIMGKILKISKQLNISVVFISHDFDQISHYAENVLKLKRGEIIFHGTKEAYFELMYKQGKYRQLPREYFYLRKINETLQTEFTCLKEFIENEDHNV
ncbi:MAG: ATP-binding cassette domain-containing protein [Mycoplasmatales bacterium]